MSRQSELIQALVNTLEEQIKVYRHLLEVVRKEKEILISANLDDLNENNKTKEAMLIKIRSLETVRLESASELARLLGLNPEDPRLLEMARVLPTEEAERFRNIHSVLDLLLRRVQEHNRQNEILVQSALDNITGAMNVIRDSLQEKPTYQRKGDVNQQQGSVAGALVSREA